MKPVRSTSHKGRPQTGFIALVSTIIISFVLFYAVVSVGQRGISSRFLLLGLEQKSASENLAEGCVAVALISVVNNPAYTVLSSSPISVPIGSGTCTIYSVSQSGGVSTIETKAVVSGATTNLRVVVNNTNGSVVSWRELPILP